MAIFYSSKRPSLGKRHLNREKIDKNGALPKEVVRRSYVLDIQNSQIPVAFKLVKSTSTPLDSFAFDYEVVSTILTLDIKLVRKFIS